MVDSFRKDEQYLGGTWQFKMGVEEPEENLLPSFTTLTSPFTTRDTPYPYPILNTAYITEPRAKGGILLITLCLGIGAIGED